MSSIASVPATDFRGYLHGVLALELSSDNGIARGALRRLEAEGLAARLGLDLDALVPRVRELDLVFAAAHFDPAETLRPGWPLHRRLVELGQRRPQAGAGAGIIAFGADRADRVPQPLQCDHELRGGQLRVLPFSLIGDVAVVTPVAESLESVLLDRGMASAETALYAQDAFATKIEHARYLTIHDLAAMTALQYRNQGLEALWRVVECALLRPEQPVLLDQPPEPLLRYADGCAQITLFPPALWRRRYATQDDPRPDHLARIHARFETRQRQYAAVLRAHGIEVVFDYDEGIADV